MSEVNAGTLIAYLRLDRSDYDQEMRAAGAKADELAAKSPNIKVKVDSAQALAQLAAVAAATKRLQDAQGAERVAEQRLQDLRAKGVTAGAQYAKAEEGVERARRAQAQATIQLSAAYAKADADAKKLQNTESGLSRFAKAAKNDTSGLVTTLLAIAPAIIPIAGVALGAAGAMGLLGAAGVLAVLGISREIKKGTPLGQQYAQTLSVLKGNLSGLEHSAASGFLGPFNAAVQRSQALMPGLNAEMKTYGGLVGNIAGHLFVGLIGGLHTLAPLFDRVAVMLDHGATSFERWANSSDGLGKFGATVEQWLPHVVSTLGDLFKALGHVSAAMGPLGSTSLTVLGALANVINALPVPVITALATAFISLRIASMGLNVLSSVANAIRNIGPASIATAGALLVLSVQMTRHAQAAAFMAQMQQSLNEAVKQSKGAIDENVRSTVAQNLASQGALEQGKKVGLSTKTLTDAVLGNADAMKQVSDAVGGSMSAHRFLLMIVKAEAAQFKDATDQYKDFTNAATENNKALAKANPALARQASALGLTITALMGAKAAADQKRESDAQALAVLALAHPEYLKASNALGMNATAYLHAKDAVDQQKRATAESTAEMRLANDAAGLLKQALDALNGKALSAADAQNAFDSSLVNMGDHTTATGKKVKFTTKSIGDMSAASVALRGQLNGQIHNLEAVAEANGGLANATGHARTQLISMRQQIINNAVAHGVDRKAVTAYVDALFKIPKSVPKTKLEIDDANARARIRALAAYVASFRPVMEVQTHTTGPTGGVTNAGKAVQKATGGPVMGPGTSTSDSIPAWLSNGEYVMQASAVKKYGRAFFDKANAMKLAAGGAVGNAAKSAQQRANIRFTVATDLPKVFSAILGSVSSLSSTLSKLLRDVHTAATKGAASNGVVGTVQRENAQLLSLASRRAGIANKLKAANTALSAVQGKYSGERSNVAQASASFFNLTQANTTDKGSFTADLENRASYIKKYAADLKSLQKKGLHKNLVQQLGEAGVDQGYSAAHLLVGMSAAQLKHVNALDSQARGNANNVGTAVANSLYGAGVNAAKGLVAGLRSQEKTLAAQMRSLAKVMVDQIKHDLKIHSPSQVFHELGGFLGQGLANGMQAKHATVRQAARSMAATTLPVMGQGSGMARGGETTVNIHPRANQSEYDIGMAAKRELDWAGR